jgi:hypothetical protein
MIAVIALGSHLGNSTRVLGEAMPGCKRCPTNQERGQPVLWVTPFMQRVDAARREKHKRQQREKWKAVSHVA